MARLECVEVNSFISLWPSEGEEESETTLLQEKDKTNGLDLLLGDEY